MKALLGRVALCICSLVAMLLVGGCPAPAETGDPGGAAIAGDSADVSGDELPAGDATADDDSGAAPSSPDDDVDGGVAGAISGDANTGDSGADALGDGATEPPSAVQGEPITATYQNGANGYSGASAADISTLGGGSWNLNQGTTFTDDADWCIGDMPARSYSISPLLRFDNLGIPSNATVVSATLQLTFVDVWDGPGQKVVGHYLNVPWATSQGYGGAGVGWNYRDTGLAWSVAGARGEGTDVVAGKSFEFVGIAVGSRQQLTTTLDAQVVQGWIANSDANYGIVLTVDLLDHHVGFRQPQNSHVEDRPVLTITYTLPAAQ